jgi:hypothetical protein
VVWQGTPSLAATIATGITAIITATVTTIAIIAIMGMVTIIDCQMKNGAHRRPVS